MSLTLMVSNLLAQAPIQILVPVDKIVSQMFIYKCIHLRNVKACLRGCDCTNHRICIKRADVIKFFNAVVVLFVALLGI